MCTFAAGCSESEYCRNSVDLLSKDNLTTFNGKKCNICHLYGEFHFHPNINSVSKVPLYRL